MNLLTAYFTFKALYFDVSLNSLSCFQLFVYSTDDSMAAAKVLRSVDFEIFGIVQGEIIILLVRKYIIRIFIRTF